jgi:hypothetical protein
MEPTERASRQTEPSAPATPTDWRGAVGVTLAPNVVRQRHDGYHSLPAVDDIFRRAQPGMEMDSDVEAQSDISSCSKESDAFQPPQMRRKFRQVDDDISVSRMQAVTFLEENRKGNCEEDCRGLSAEVASHNGEEQGVCHNGRYGASRACQSGRPMTEPIGRLRMPQDMVNQENMPAYVNMSTESRHALQYKPVLPTVKLGRFDGSISLETFLAKFENSMEYYGWDNRERLCHSRVSLDVEAGQILWDTRRYSTAYDLISLLRRRFGSQHQEERYCAELRSRRRRSREALQTIYHDIRRLMSLAFPGHDGALREIMARDAFVEALNDPALGIRILEKDHATLDETLKIVCRLEALERVESEDIYDDGGRRKDRHRYVKAVSNEKESLKDNNITVELQRCLGDCRNEIKVLREDPHRLS